MSGALARRHPLARLGAAFVLMLFVFVALDGVTAALVLAVVIVAMPPSGVPLRSVASRAWPVVVAAIAIGLLNALLSAGGPGELLWAVGPLRLTDTSLLNGASLAVRLVAIAVTALVGLARVEPTELADALTQQLHLPARFAIGALAATRLVPLFRMEWEILGLARRARGIDAGRSPVAAVSLFGSRSHTLLTGAIRRGLRLAYAMDARGFGALPCRTSARDRAFGAADWLVLAGAAATGAAATAVSVAAGTWRFVLG
ncbi:MAG: energy-coupling factor transporter transmembrane protein EcfT [Candidatus Limnocylindria bacterium]